MKRILLAVALFFSVAVQSREFVDPINSQSNQIARVSNEDISFEFPQFIFSHTNTTITVKFKNPEHVKLASNNYRLHFIVNGNDQIVAFDKKGEGTVTCIFKNTNKLSVLFEDVSYQMQLPVISIWYMILPLGGLLLFLMYKIAFAKKNMTLSKRDITEKIIDTASKSNLKVVSRREEEVLV
jgi:archaellum component FlaG (FlaF/FlaG flagellin family)